MFALQGITESILKRFGATYCPFLMSLARFVTKAPGKKKQVDINVLPVLIFIFFTVCVKGDLNRIEMPLTPLLERPLKSKKKQRQQQQQATLTPAISLAIASHLSMTSSSTLDATVVSSSATTTTPTVTTPTEQPLHTLAFEQMLSREQLIMNAFPLELTADEASAYATVASACACVNYVNTSTSNSTQVPQQKYTAILFLL